YSLNYLNFSGILYRVITQGNLLRLSSCRYSSYNSFMHDMKSIIESIEEYLDSGQMDSAHSLLKQHRLRLLDSHKSWYEDVIFSLPRKYFDELYGNKHSKNSYLKKFTIRTPDAPRLNVVNRSIMSAEQVIFDKLGKYNF